MTKYSATKDEVMRRLREGVSIIHIATHGKETSGELVLSPGHALMKRSLKRTTCLQ